MKKLLLILLLSGCHENNNTYQIKYELLQKGNKEAYKAIAPEYIEDQKQKVVDGKITEEDLKIRENTVSAWNDVNNK